MKHKLPFKFSYKVTDTFYAGEYPFEILEKDGIPKLQCLLDFGVTTIIDLTSEQLTPYDEHLPDSCVRLHYPTIDYTSPDFSTLKEIHTIIEEVKEYGEKIYVHCKGGHDRTGVVVATYFIHAGFSPSEAKQKFYKVFVPPVRGRYSHLPLIETKWKLLDQYQEWLQKEDNETKQAEINHNAVRVLWEGLNSKREFRRVLYFPYMDGYVMLLVTDANGKTINTICDYEISRKYLPEEYWDDVPSRYTFGRLDPEWSN